MNLSDEIAIFSDRIVTCQEHEQMEFADQLLHTLNKDVNVEEFFSVPPDQPTANASACNKQNQEKKAHIYNIQQDQNAQIYNRKDWSNSIQDMPSGEIFEVLTQEYQFHSHNTTVRSSPIFSKIENLPGFA